MVLSALITPFSPVSYRPFCRPSFRPFCRPFCHPFCPLLYLHLSFPLLVLIDFLAAFLVLLVLLEGLDLEELEEEVDKASGKGLV